MTGIVAKCTSFFHVEWSNHGLGRYINPVSSWVGYPRDSAIDLPREVSSESVVMRFGFQQRLRSPMG